MILYSEKHLELSYNSQRKLLKQKWTGFATSQEFRSGIDKVFEICQTYEVQFVLNDVKEQKIVSKEDTDYAGSVVPEMVKLGLKKFAFVIPSNIFTQMSVKNFTQVVLNKDFEMEYFDDATKAVNWLA